MLHADLLVVGGGLVGASLATAVSSHPFAASLSVVLVDPAVPSIESWPSTSLRTSTITPSSKQFLDDIGVWARVPDQRIASFDKMFVWDHPQPLPIAEAHTKASASPAGTIVFDSDEIQQDCLGYVLDNDTLRNAMFRRLHELVLDGNSGLRIIAGNVKSIDYDGGQAHQPDEPHDLDAPNEPISNVDDSAPWPVVELESGELIRCRLIAACDGSRSRVRTMCGADWFRYGYGQSAVVANVQLKDVTTTAYQRFVSTGPVAVLPVATEDTSAPVGNVIWTTTPTEAGALVAANESDFVNELNIVLAAHEDEDVITASSFYPSEDERRRTPWHWVANAMQSALPNVGTDGDVLSFIPPPEATSIIGKRGQFPLTLGHSPQYVHHKKRTVLVGDAAHSVHPLAGQGVNLGFADAQCLADCIASAVGTGRDIGGEMGAPLMRYQSERLVGNLGMMGVLHGLQQVFGIENSAFRDWRRAGISALNFSSPLKKAILRAMR
ncbi:Aromatic-ring hydroxylase (flavoprotein monooxygenase) [Gracilaria domingensis]|nr:Aromatic-ring hydroxylase (flavoprotein monooxygenase) [Gracilaria domingensis]